MKILILESDNYTAEALKIALLEVSYTVEIATENFLWWELLDLLAYDLIILDGALSNFDNLCLCRKLREKGYVVPVILILDSHNQQDIKTSLDAGVSRCIVKPFDVQELIWQIDSLVHKNYSFNLTLPSIIYLNLNSKQLTYKHHSVELDVQEISILELFLRYKTRVFSCSAILALILSLDSAITKPIIRNLINKIEHKLKTLGIHDAIETVHGNGYRLRYSFVNSALIGSKYPLTQVKLMPDFWLICQDKEFISSFSSEVANWGINTQVVRTVGAAVTDIPNEPDNIILLDMSISDRTEGLREVLAEIYSTKTYVPLVALLSEEDIKERLILSDFYLQAVCYKSASPTQILDIVTKSITKSQLPECRILLIDRHPETLLQVRSLLEPWGFIIVTLENDSKFWETISFINPELLILGELNCENDAFKLCESLRKDPRWANLSIVFLSSNLDNLEISRIFEAGGDDFISLPIIEAELVNRVLSCWEKVKLNRYCVPTDVINKVTNRDEYTKDLEKLLHLARRQNQILSLVVMYINNFYEIQKLFGYVSVNDVLQFISSFLQESLRTEDVVVCWGEEFAIGMYGINKVDAVERLNKIVTYIRDRQFTATNGSTFQLNCSIGVGQYPQDGTDINLLYHFTRKNCTSC